ncbi:MAG: hypothetical protein ACLTOZ_09915 [[Clostridium] leptum]
MNAGKKVSGGSEAHQYMVKLAFEAMKVTAVLNQGYHEPEEIFVITKLYPNQFANAEEAVDEALDKLDIEYIDMMRSIIPETMMWKRTRRWSRRWRKEKSAPSAYPIGMWRS